MKSLSHFDQVINQALQDWRVPGAAVAIIKGEEILHMKGHGYRDLENSLPITEHTRFLIASMTKSFTAMGAAILVDEGFLAWDQPIRDLLPDFRLADDYATAHATLRDLLSHRTGLPRYDITWIGSGKTRQEIFDGLRHLKPSADFRTLWQYNNLMYEVVGLLCARVSGAESWEAFIHERVIAPLGLAATTANAEHPEGKEFDDIAFPYRLKCGETTPHRAPVYDNHLGPAGSIHSILSGLVTWVRVHAHGGSSKAGQLVSLEKLHVMHSPHMLIPPAIHQSTLFSHQLFSYGLGWFVEPYQGISLCHHGGNIGGFSLMAAFVPQEDISLVVLTNIQGKAMAKAMMYESLDRVLGVECGKSKNWSSEYLKITQKFQEEAADALLDSASARIANAPASHELISYAGTYVALGYTNIVIKLEGDKLLAFFAGEWFDLVHCHYDIFELDMVESRGEKRKAYFLTIIMGL
jgi:CubicO group peptidase (beta-lactamase class C family)